jgi:hypothetical protein
VSPLEPYAADDIKRKKKYTFERDTSEDDALKRFVYSKELIETFLKEHKLKEKKMEQTET